MPPKDSAEKAVRDIRRKTRRKFSAEEKIRIFSSAEKRRLVLRRISRTAFSAEGFFSMGFLSFRSRKPSLTSQAQFVQTRLTASSGLGRHGCKGLFLRPTEPMATWDQREHEPSAAPVLPEEDGSIALLAGRPEPSSSSIESATRKDAGFPFPSRSAQRDRRVDRLNRSTFLSSSEAHEEPGVGTEPAAPGLERR